MVHQAQVDQGALFDLVVLTVDFWLLMNGVREPHHRRQGRHWVKVDCGEKGLHLSSLSFGWVRWVRDAV